LDSAEKMFGAASKDGQVLIGQRGKNVRYDQQGWTGIDLDSAERMFNKVEQVLIGQHGKNVQ
jgi:hypothetical protein